MNYVISDIHGKYNLFLRMLEKIHFSNSDTLWLLGDMIDRGPDGILLLQDIMHRKNVNPFLGNHEDMFYRIIRHLGKQLPREEIEEVKADFTNWIGNNGGRVTWSAYAALSEPERRKLLSFLETFRVYEEIDVGRNTFLLVHAGVGRYAPDKNPEECSLHDLIWEETDYNYQYFSDKYLVTGHTPTFLIDRKLINKIYMKNNHIAVDCGAVFTGTLGCICLETLQEFYVSET